MPSVDLVTTEMIEYLSGKTLDFPRRSNLNNPRDYMAFLTPRHLRGAITTNGTHRSLEVLEILWKDPSQGEKSQLQIGQPGQSLPRQ